MFWESDQHLFSFIQKEIDLLSNFFVNMAGTLFSSNVDPVLIQLLSPLFFYVLWYLRLPSHFGHRRSMVEQLRVRPFNGWTAARPFNGWRAAPMDQWQAWELIMSKVLANERPKKKCSRWRRTPHLNRGTLRLYDWIDTVGPIQWKMWWMLLSMVFEQFPFQTQMHLPLLQRRLKVLAAPHTGLAQNEISWHNSKFS